ncbi:MAG: F0F1 ATP synthase subunit delta [Steroidobacteraceae bacterium]
MAENATTARPYARAAFEAASGANALASWDEFLRVAATAVADERVHPLVGSPLVPAARLVAFIASLAGSNAGVGQQNFLKLLAENRRLTLLPEIAAQFAVLRAEAEGQADVEVQTALELDADQLGKLGAALTQRLQRKVRLTQKIDPTLIGGAIVRHGDLVFDGSLRGRLERLAATMTRA